MAPLRTGGGSRLYLRNGPGRDDRCCHLPDCELRQGAAVLSTSPQKRIFDDDSGEVWANVMFELVRPRLEGDFKGSREIGSANLVTALNLIHQKLLIQSTSQSSELSMKIFNEALSNLQEQRLVRRKPEKIRESFKVYSSNTTT